MVTSIEAMIEFIHPLFQLEQNSKQGWTFHMLTRQHFRLLKIANSMEAVAKSVITESSRVAKKTKKSWTYMRENGFNSLHLFLHQGFSIVASLAHP